MLRVWMFVVLLSLCTPVPLWSADASGVMIEAKVRGRQVEGLPLNWSAERVHLLGRDGHLWDFHPDEASDFKQIGSSFRSYSAGELRAQLQREFGSDLEVTGTGHYLVAHPPGEGSAWAQRFEDLYREFLHFFNVRGFRLREPQFPLVAIVWTRQEDFARYSQAHDTPVSPGVLGYYSPATNRVVLFDSTAGQGNDTDWQQNAETIIHETTHQTAFNTGVHSRYAMPPRWVAEGLGTLYEAPGIWKSSHYRNQSDRVNRGRLEQFRTLVSRGRPNGLIVGLISDDRLFGISPNIAYAEAWAFTFFLTETRPQKYCQYLTRTAARTAFVDDYPSAARLADFTAVFGNNLRLLEAEYLRFMEGIGAGT